VEATGGGFTDVYSLPVDRRTVGGVEAQRLSFDMRLHAVHAVLAVLSHPE